MLTHHHHSTCRPTPTVSIFYYFFFFFFFTSAVLIATTTTTACIDGGHHHHHLSVRIYHHTHISFYFIFSFFTSVYICSVDDHDHHPSASMATNTTVATCTHHVAGKHYFTMYSVVLTLFSLSLFVPLCGPVRVKVGVKDNQQPTPKWLR